MTAIYKNYGVDIDSGNQFTEQIKHIAEATSNPGIVSSIGGYGAILDLKADGFTDPLLVVGADGVGSKLFLAQQRGYHRQIGIDLVAMCVNDVLCHGAKPLYFLDYYATGKLDVDKGVDIVKGIADGCQLAGCSLVGGETAELPVLYKKNEYELAGFCIGAVERENLLPKKLKEGDVIFGLESNGIHANGFSMITKDFSDPDMLDEVMKPTKIYTKNVGSVMHLLKAMAHITGGGIVENVPRVISDGLCAHIKLNWKLPEIFKWIMSGEGLPMGHLPSYRQKVSEQEMLRVFNCGIGMVLILDKQNEAEVWQRLTQMNEKVHYLGIVHKSKQDKKIKIYGSFER